MTSFYMRNAFLAILCCFFSYKTIAQVKIGDNPSDINNSSLLEMESTDKGLLIPRLTESQRTAITTPATGLLVFQTNETSGFYFYDGEVWEILLADTSRIHTAVRNLNIVGKGAGATKTTTILIDNAVVEQFSIDDELYFDISDPIDYSGGDLTIIIDFIPMGAETGKVVHWNLLYKVTQPEGIISGTTGTLDSEDLALNPDQYQEQDIVFTIPAAELINAEAIHFKLKRVEIDSGSDPSVDPAVLHCNVRYNSFR